MAVSKAQQKAVNKYMAANYDRINLTVPKGRKEEIQAFAAQTGESVNGFINRAIGEAMGRKARGLSLPLPHLKRRRRPHREPGKRFPRSSLARLIFNRSGTRSCKD